MSPQLKRSARRSLPWMRLLLVIAFFPKPFFSPPAKTGHYPPGRAPAIESGDIPRGPGRDYIVQPGDDLGGLAQRFNITVEAIIQANDLFDRNQIHAGDTLIIPYRPPTLYLNSRPDPRRGLAMAVSVPGDLVTLGVGWYYTWDWCALPGCVPMVYWMELPPACPEVLLVGNEPNAAAPFGGPTLPADAAQRVLAIETVCPSTRLVAGNVSADDWSQAGGWGGGRDWLVEFLAHYRDLSGHAYQQTIGVHCYTQALAQYCLTRLAELRALYAGPMWLTEFGLVSGDAEEFAILLDFAAAHFERFAAYTNRQPHTGQGWELGTGVELIRPDGRPAPAGEIYAAGPTPLQSQVR